MEEKLRFVFDYERDEHSMLELCSRYGICRDTGYEWLRRFRLHGVKGLVELNRAAKQHPNQAAAGLASGAAGAGFAAGSAGAGDAGTASLMDAPPRRLILSIVLFGGVIPRK